MRLRNGTLSQIAREGWAPTASFEVPNETKLPPKTKPGAHSPTSGPAVDSGSHASLGTASSDNIDDLEEVDISDLGGTKVFA